MDILKILAGFLFFIGVPLLCLFLLRWTRVQNMYMPFLGWGLLVIGGFMAILAAMSFASDLFVLESAQKDVDWWVAFAVWFIPPVLIACTGWILRKRKKDIS